jgi:hypothetical protein
MYINLSRLNYKSLQGKYFYFLPSFENHQPNLIRHVLSVVHQRTDCSLVQHRIRVEHNTGRRFFVDPTFCESSSGQGYLCYLLKEIMTWAFDQKPLD